MDKKKIKELTSKIVGRDKSQKNKNRLKAAIEKYATDNGGYGKKLGAGNKPQPYSKKDGRYGSSIEKESLTKKTDDDKIYLTYDNDIESFVKNNGFSKNEVLKRLLKSEVESVGNYTNSGYCDDYGYGGINRLLFSGRQPNVRQKEIIENLTNAINKFTLKEDIEVYRNFIGDMDKVKERGFIEGKTYLHKAFLSTSVSQDSAESFGNVFMKIYVPRNSNALFVRDLTEMKTEDELLFAPNVEILIEKVEETNECFENDIRINIIGRMKERQL